MSIFILTFLFMIAFSALPVFFLIRDANRNDDKDFKIISGSNSGSGAKKEHTHLKKTLLVCAIAFVFFWSILFFGVSDSHKRHEDDIRFAQAIRDSDCFSDVEYEDGTLYLTFSKNDTTYKYVEIPGKLYNEFYHSDNLGEFYNLYIKGKYPSLRIN